MISYICFKFDFHKVRHSCLIAKYFLFQIPKTLGLFLPQWKTPFYNKILKNIILYKCKVSIFIVPTPLLSHCQATFWLAFLTVNPFPWNKINFATCKYIYIYMEPVKQILTCLTVELDWFWRLRVLSLTKAWWLWRLLMKEHSLE